MNSGTDALVAAMHSLGIGKDDEVLTPPNSFVASTSSIVHLGAKPVFIEVSEDQNIDVNIIKHFITKKTKAIMPVHLTGRMANMEVISEIANKYNLFVIEDAAQSIGSKYKGKLSGSIGDIGCFSAHPLKNLNACGDAGFLITNNDRISKFIKSIRNHGLIDRNEVAQFGYVSRMDTLQAAILNYRLKNLPSVIKKRRKNAEQYFNLIDSDKFLLPFEKKYEFNTYHTFVIQTEKRDALKNFLLNKGIETSIHYPIPIHMQPASKMLNYKKGDFPITEKQSETILTLPIHQYLEDHEIQYISKCLNEFYKSNAHRN